MPSLLGCVILVVIPSLLLWGALVVTMDGLYGWKGAVGTFLLYVVIGLVAVAMNFLGWNNGM